MIGRMRPFYQAHWDISKDIKHVWLLFCTYYIAWIFQWILGDEGRGEWWLHQVHRADRQHRVWTPQCAASWMLLLYAGDSSRWLLTPGPQFLSRGAQTFWHRAYSGYLSYCCLSIISNQSAHSPLTFDINKEFSSTQLPLTGYFLFFGPFSVNPRDGCVWKSQ